MDVAPYLLLWKVDILFLCPLHDELEIALFSPLDSNEELVELVVDEPVEVLDYVRMVQALMQLNLLETAVSLLFVLHVENLN